MKERQPAPLVVIGNSRQSEIRCGEKAMFDSGGPRTRSGLSKSDSMDNDGIA